MEIFMKYIRKYFVVMCFVLACMSKTSFGMNNDLLMACKNNSLNDVARLLENGHQKHVNSVDDEDKTSLYWASENNNLEMVKLLLRNGARITQDAVLSAERHKNGLMLHFLFFVACKRNNTAIAKLFLDAAIKMKKKEDGTWDRSWVDARSCLIDLARRVVNKHDKEGNTPLLFACQFENFPIIRLLLRNGAAITENVAVFVLRHKKTKTIRLFVSHACRGNNLNLVMFLLVNGEKIGIDLADVMVETLLHSVCLTNNIGMASFILEKGAQKNINLADDIGKTPLHYACEESSTKMVELLLKNGAKESVNVADRHGKTPLYWACHKKDLEMAQLLLYNGAQESVNVADEELGYTPLHWACGSGDLELIGLLLANGAQASVNVIAEYGARTPLECFCEENHLDCENNQLEVVKLLLKYGAEESLNSPHYDDVVHTPLWYACKGNNLKVVKLLLKYGAGANVIALEPAWSSTLPYFACRNNNLEMLKLLLKYGARENINAIDPDDDSTPLMRACDNDNVEMAKLLLQYGASVSDEMVDETNDQEIERYLELVVKYNRAENKLEFITEQKETGNEEDAAFLAEKLFLDSMEQVVNNERTIETTIFANMYAQFDKTFLKKTFDVDIQESGKKKSVWEYTKQVIKKKKLYANQKCVNQYEFHKKLYSTQKYTKSLTSPGIKITSTLRQAPDFAKASSDRSLGRQDDRGVLGKRKRAERLGPNKKQKRENNRNC